jgi:hypothetical protein
MCDDASDGTCISQRFDTSVSPPDNVAVVLVTPISGVGRCFVDRVQMGFRRAGCGEQTLKRLSLRCRKTATDVAVAHWRP